MKHELTALEARVIGCLIEKQITTPEQYPLSLNALTNACNQKSNRDPVLELSERELQDVLDALSRKHLVLEKSGFGSRVPKYQQRFCNMEFSALKFTPQETAVLCELLLRGPQTPGELRIRAGRMADFIDVSQVEATLDALIQRDTGALVMRLSREPGKRELRYAQLFSGVIPLADTMHGTAPTTAVAGPGAAPASMAATVSADRLATLEAEMRQLRAELEALKHAVRSAGGVVPPGAA